jgi:hypothetical protein
VRRFSSRVSTLTIDMTRAAPIGPLNGMPEIASAAGRSAQGCHLQGSGTHMDDDLDFIEEAEETTRADGTVDQAGRQRFKLAGRCA